MPGIAFQRHGAMNARRSEHHPGQCAVERRAQQGQRQPPAQLLERRRVPDSGNRRPQNGHAGTHDQNTFKARGKILGLVVTVGMIVVGLARRNGHHGQRKHGARQVDKRLQRIRQQADRARQPPSQRLEHNGEQRHHNRQTQKIARLHPARRGCVIPNRVLQIGLRHRAPSLIC